MAGPARWVRRGAVGASRSWWLLLLLAFAIAIAIGPAQADWPMYRGPAGNGVSTERIRTDWNTNPPQRLWRTPLTNGLSSVTVSGGRVFTQVRSGSPLGGVEVCVALDAANGRFLWTTTVDQARYPDGGVGGDDGPRSTPAVSGARVYVLGSYLNLHCLDAANGTNIWSKNLRTELGGSVIPWQNAASPLLEGDLLLVNCNASPQALVGLRQSDGGVVWRLHNERMTHATPVPATIQGERQVIFMAQSGPVGVQPSTGRQLWRHPFPYSTSTGASPTVDGDVVYCAAAYARGSGAARLTKTDTGFAVTNVWGPRSTRMIHWSTPVAVQGYIYGLFGSNGGQLRCLDLRDGNYAWEGPDVGLGAILLVDGRLLVASENGEIILAEPDPAAYREVARFEAVNGRIWNSPAISDGVLYVRGTTELAAYSVSRPPPPSLRLGATWDARVRTLQFEIANADGQPIASERASRIQIVQAEDARVPLPQWTPTAVALTLQSGVLRGELKPPERPADLYYVAREDE